MTFSDKDLEQWRRWITAAPEDRDHGLSIRQAQALLSRLDAAERVCKNLEGMTIECNHKPFGWDGVDLAFKAWRRECGE